MNRTSYNCSLDNLDLNKIEKSGIDKDNSLSSSFEEVDLLPNFDLDTIDYRKIKVVSNKGIFDLNFDSEGYIFLLRGSKSGINGYHKSVKDIVIRTWALITYYEKEGWKIIVVD
ncbi:hypothetical protein [Flammeovirga sp. EKP202]|uniref:hypothetical protein n=1 Tax=Flammeovirga sp. EKP202 TaxID=2770592 RepID=UPI00165F70F2|nr:hypothetical protein [Flammeovirga sp. EKP202]MBD0403194.1 hypothetical protein [Flammeovirga sp. EKP202]